MKTSDKLQEINNLAIGRLIPMEDYVKYSWEDWEKIIFALQDLIDELKKENK